MEWKVTNALSRDVEREQLNKILKEIRAAIDGSISAAPVTNVIERTNTRYAVARFNLTLDGDVTGTALVDGLNDVTITTTVGDLPYVEEAPITNRAYWRWNGEWRAVNDTVTGLDSITGNGFLVSYRVDEDSIRQWASREIQGTSNRITVTDGDGVDADPVIDIAATYVGQTSITTLGTISTGVWQGTVVGLAYGGTGASLSDPNADKILFWDDSAGAVTWLTIGSNLSITGTTLDATGGGGGSGDSVVLEIAATAHGFVVGTPVTLNGSTWVAADRDDDTRMAELVVSEVVDSDNFKGIRVGLLTLTTAEWDAVTGGSGGLIQDEYYWLSSNAGEITDTAPTTGLKQNILYALSDTDALVSIGEAFDAVAGGGGGGSGDMVNLGSATVTGSPASSITVSSLDLSAYASFMVVFSVKDNSGAGAVSLFYNSDTTATNYNTEVVAGVPGIVTGRANNANITSLDSGLCTSGKIDIIADADGYPQAIGISCRGRTTLSSEWYSHVWNSATNVTSITLSASSLAVGSKMTVYGLLP
jgi:hypothetical protein